MWIKTTNTSNSHFKSLFRVVLDTGDQNSPCIAYKTTRGFEYWTGSIAELQQSQTGSIFLMPFAEKSVSRAPYRVLWESKALAPLLHASASKNPLYRVCHSTVRCEFVPALAPEASNLWPRAQGKKVMATAACLHEEEEVQPGLSLISVQEESSQCHMGFQLLSMKSQNSAFSDNCCKGNEFCFGNYWPRASGFGFQPRAKVQAEILIRIAQELPLKKQPYNGTNNFSATIYSS